ncbi:hypothetical protein MRX96_059830 [Rhipicephalus microplus]
MSRPCGVMASKEGDRRLCRDRRVGEEARNDAAEGAVLMDSSAGSGGDGVCVGVRAEEGGEAGEDERANAAYS